MKKSRLHSSTTHHFNPTLRGKKHKLTKSLTNKNILFVVSWNKHVMHTILLVSEYMANKLSSGGISAETLWTIANDKGANRLDALLTPFTKKKIPASIYSKL